MSALSGSLEGHDTPAFCAFSNLVFVKLSETAFERISPRGPIIADTVGVLPAADGKRDACAVDCDDWRLVDEEYSWSVLQDGVPPSMRSRRELAHVPSALGKRFSLNCVKFCESGRP